MSVAGQPDCCSDGARTQQTIFAARIIPGSRRGRGGMGSWAAEWMMRRELRSKCLLGHGALRHWAGQALQGPLHDQYSNRFRIPFPQRGARRRRPVRTGLPTHAKGHEQLFSVLISAGGTRLVRRRGRPREGDDRLHATETGGYAPWGTGGARRGMLRDGFFDAPAS